MKSSTQANVEEKCRGMEKRSLWIAQVPLQKYRGYISSAEGIEQVTVESRAHCREIVEEHITDA